jgi:hypothetical protein
MVARSVMLALVAVLGCCLLDGCGSDASEGSGGAGGGDASSVGSEGQPCNADPVQIQQCIDDCTAQPTGALCIEAHACTSDHCATECAQA